MGGGEKGLWTIHYGWRGRGVEVELPEGLVIAPIQPLSDVLLSPRGVGPPGNQNYLLVH